MDNIIVSGSCIRVSALIESCIRKCSPILYMTSHLIMITIGLVSSNKWWRIQVINTNSLAMLGYHYHYSSVLVIIWLYFGRRKGTYYHHAKKDLVIVNLKKKKKYPLFTLTNGILFRVSLGTGKI